MGYLAVVADVKSFNGCCQISIQVLAVIKNCRGLLKNCQGICPCLIKSGPNSSTDRNSTQNLGRLAECQVRLTNIPRINIDQPCFLLPIQKPCILIGQIISRDMFHVTIKHGRTRMCDVCVNTIGINEAWEYIRLQFED